ncbi:MAG: HAD family phosphatase, partial [Ruminiclostridium sp.]|nr:HAD family phosphatase [Ruminiclostridium sp.]
MIKNIIFDIGDVLVKTRQLDFFVDKGFDAKTAASLAEATYLTPVWKELDRGIWSLDEIVDSFVKRAPDLESNIRSS